MKKICITGMVFGVLILLVGLYMTFGDMGYYYGPYTEGYTFGADYYTEQYAATQNAANNLRAIGNYLEYVFGLGATVFGIITAAFGGIVTCYFRIKMIESEERKTDCAEVEPKQETVEEEQPAALTAELEEPTVESEE